eukprot:CAMPEP_0175965170 /NCGR_PEP_ID=MMETSP0108-20121206/37960_1 /TAXON_ID=195067 ORGANISM="Goniomonas pacifica, Strain CCMP1869" /NCGR_SAMPLE_ID=MMETSP0108 /ASSEMBLY_ACC=CAM_ASM_000204 /LENGTH=70 /DNA_ID=CAMNT_0017293217 /DNA_START=861 /DNA_END=1073 /DNA_ORIENTATION=+
MLPIWHSHPAVGDVQMRWLSWGLRQVSEISEISLSRTDSKQQYGGRSGKFESPAETTQQDEERGYHIEDQ